MNLNIATLLSEEFLEFDQDFTHGAQEAVFELRLEDIVSGLPSFIFARDFVHERGYRICIDGVSLATIRYADTNRLNVGYAKLMWSNEMAAIAGTPKARANRDLIWERQRGRVIMSHCDSGLASSWELHCFKAVISTYCGARSTEVLYARRATPSTSYTEV